MSSSDCQSCSEYMQLSRRQFLATTGGIAAAMSLPAWIPQVVYAEDDCSDRDIIIAIFLRGGADGLTLCVPHGEDTYYAERPQISIPRPDASGDFKVIDLDGFFGLPPQMGALIPAYQNGDLLVIHSAGSTDPTRSHFDAQRYMEVGKPGDALLFSGWLARHLQTSTPLFANSILRGIGVNYGLQRSLQDAPLTVPIPDLTNYNLSGDLITRSARRDTIEAMHAGYSNSLSAAAETTQHTIDLLQAIDFANYQPAGGAVYPTSSFGRSLKSVAALLKAEVGVEAVALDMGGWDSHIQQVVTPGGGMSNLLTGLGNALGAFHADIFSGPRRNVTVVVMSEFGRRVEQNASLGTDHGHGNVMFLMGPGIDGGRVFSDWPGIEIEDRFEGFDLAVTTDYRDVLAEIVQNRLGNPNLDLIFPGYTPTFRGVTRSCLRGDMNCDGVRNEEDVAPFSEAMIDVEAYKQAHPTCSISGADLNEDGVIDGRDVAAFIDRLME